MSDALRCVQHTGEGPILTLVRSHGADGAWVEHYTCPKCPASGHITRPTRNGDIDKRFGPAVNPAESVGAAHTTGGETRPEPVADGGHESEFRLTCEDCDALDETYDTYALASYWSSIHGEAGHVPRIEERTLATDGGTPPRYPRLEVLSLVLVVTGIGMSLAALDAGLPVLTIMGVVLGLVGLLILVAVNPPEVTPR